MLNGKRTAFLISLTIFISSFIYLFVYVLPLPIWFVAVWKKPLADKAAGAAGWFGFDKEQDLQGWEEKIFKGKSIYVIVPTRRGGFLSAYSQKSASGLLYWINFDPKEQPMVSWKWKALKLPEKKGGAATPQEGEWIEKDDYAARFYVIFPRFPFTRVQSLEYVWDRELPEGTVVDNPAFPNLKIIVAESGEKNLGRWVLEERNIYADFIKVFDGKPGKVGAIAIMTDADNSQSTAEAQYDDIRVGYEK